MGRFRVPEFGRAGLLVLFCLLHGTPASAQSCFAAISEILKFAHTPTPSQADLYRNASIRIFLLDYDGTLARSLNSADQSQATAHLRSLLLKLTEDPRNLVYIITGREDAWLDAQFGDIPGLGFSSEHGLFIREARRKSSWHRLNVAKPVGLEKVNEILTKFVSTHPETRVVKKREGLAWSFAGISPRERGLELREELRPLLNAAIVGTNLRIEDSNSGIEVLGVNINKSVPTREILDSPQIRPVLKDAFVLLAGDGISDVHMFLEAAARVPHSNLFVAPVGPKIASQSSQWGIPSSQIYEFRNPDSFVAFLSELSQN